MLLKCILIQKPAGEDEHVDCIGMECESLWDREKNQCLLRTFFSQRIAPPTEARLHQGPGPIQADYNDRKKEPGS